jgi:hypothetical protein
MHEARHESLQELPLAEHELDLVPHTTRDVLRAVVRLRPPDLRGEELRAAPSAAAGDRDEQRENDGAYEPLTLLSSALIAGTIWWRSPITA